MCDVRRRICETVRVSEAMAVLFVMALLGLADADGSSLLQTRYSPGESERLGIDEDVAKHSMHGISIYIEPKTSTQKSLKYGKWSVWARVCLKESGPAYQSSNWRVIDFEREFHQMHSAHERI